ncbi:MAG TPA: hypothetical protein VD963_03075, partial [Phycisphaerales bacterium]|nr:hypothetical protein [Phycisphaerales bacterium]
MTPAPLVLVSVGNTRTRYALARDGQLNPGVSIPNRDLAEDAGPLLEAGGPLAPVLIASVNEPVAA